MKNTQSRRPRFDKEWVEMINPLPEPRRHILTDAIRRYQIDRTEPSGLTGAEQMAFMLIKKIVDRRHRQREASARRRENQRTDSTIQSGKNESDHTADKTESINKRIDTVNPPVRPKKRTPHKALTDACVRHRRDKMSRHLKSTKFS